jgi:N6-adenosine-specific RNA methylase IME4
MLTVTDSPASIAAPTAPSPTVEPQPPAAAPSDPFLTERAERIRGLGKRVVADVIEIGRLLTEAKQRVGHGHWLPWLQTEFGWTDETARRFMRLHELAGQIPQVVEYDIPLSGLYLLAAPSIPEPARAEVFERASAGERLRQAEVRAIIERHGEQRILAAACEVRARRLEEYRERAKATTSLSPAGPAGGTIEDLVRLAASGYRAGAILADCPWQFVTWSHIGLAGDRSQGNRGQRGRVTPYHTMPLEQICALPIEALTAPDCAVFMWVVRSHLPDALEVIRRWGFEFKSVAFVWLKGEDQEDAIKVPMGTGLWTRTGSEQCWLATRGNPRRLYADVREVIIEPRREHSRKPDCVHERIERLVAGPYLELFARRERPGWLCWGDEIPPPAPDAPDPAVAERIRQLSGMRSEFRIPRNGP